jgi:hypothetical protein
MATVTVGCKLPNGLIIESGYTFAAGQVVRLPNYKRQILNGANSTRPPGVRAVSPVNHEPGITENVDEEFFDKWVADHRDSNIVKNGLIFKMKNKHEATARAKDEAQKRTGFEPLNTSAPDPRTASFAAGIEKAKEEA